jgi:predicted O-methyltransferase YrrM
VELLEQVQAVRRQLVSSGTVVAPDGERREIFPVAIGHGEGAALRDRVIDAGALRTFETGLGFAVSTLHICEGLLANGPGACHVAMDPFQTRAAPTAGTTYAGVGLRTLEEAGVASLVEFYEEESQTVLPRLLREGRIFELAFIDGSHRFEAVFLDLVYAARLVPEGGVVFVDDTQLLPVRRAVEFCIDNLGWAVDGAGSDGDDHAWTVFRTGPAARLHRPFTEFADFRT